MKRHSIKFSFMFFNLFYDFNVKFKSEAYWFNLMPDLFVRYDKCKYTKSLEISFAWLFFGVGLKINLNN